jgi:hypothetical protein
MLLTAGNFCHRKTRQRVVLLVLVLLQLEELERFQLLELLELQLLELLVLLRRSQCCCRTHCNHHILELVCSTYPLLFHSGDACGSHSDGEFCILAPCSNCGGPLPPYWTSASQPTPT